MKHSRQHQGFPPVDLLAPRVMFWRKSRHAMCCAACEKDFVKRDRVFEDGCLTIHEGCRELHDKIEKQLFG